MQTRKLWTLAIALVMSGPAYGGETACDDTPREPFLRRLHPKGGWHPYGGGLFHWWNRACFPGCGGPDDYGRKPLPRLCWPHYSPFYTWGTPEIGDPRTDGAPALNSPH
jgi:hypothetical protein